VVITSAYLAAAALSIVPIANLYGEYVQFDRDMPQGTTAEFVAKADELIQQYPHDPRVLYGEAIRLRQKGDRAGAEADVETALGETDLLRDYLPALKPFLQAELAALLFDDHKIDEAKDMAAPACPLLPAQIVAVLQKPGLCPPTPSVALATTQDKRPGAAQTAAALTGRTPQGASPAAAVVYPDAPSRMLDRARAQLSTGAIGDAKATLHNALAAEELAGNTAPTVRANIEALLAVTLYVDGADAAAHDLAQSVCPEETTGLYAKLLKDDKLCP
jgi:hypothetical protein